MKRLALAITTAILCASSTVGTHAAPIEGCAAMSVGTKILRCTFPASGPGTFLALSPTGWQIRIRHADGSIDLIRRVKPSCSSGPYVALPESGTIPSVDGDKIDLDIATACEAAPIGPLQAGLLIGLDEVLAAPQALAAIPAR